MRTLTRFIDSAAGRIFLLLVLGVTLAILAAFSAADAAQREGFQRLRVEWTAQRIVDAVSFLDASAPNVRDDLLRTGILGLSQVPPNADATGPNINELSAPIARLAPRTSITAREMNPRSCDLPDIAVAGFTPACWLVETTMTDGQIIRATHFAPPMPSIYPRLLDPIYLSVLIAASALLAFLIAHLAAQPLHRLAQAAMDLGENLERAPLRLQGPSEVRAASHAFNAMQARLRETMSQRTRMLGAITHDLQTPLTRIRLRAERIEDHDLRERLIGDLGAMQILIREALDLAQSTDNSEDWSIIDLRAMLETLVEDATEAGHKVCLVGECAIDLKARPQALRRCLQNLLDNAIAYGGGGEVSCELEDGLVTIRIRDHGPGIPEDALERIFEPFYRVEQSRSRDTGGTGLGLTIAQSLAAKNEASLRLFNHPEGGVEAVLRFTKASFVCLQ